MNIYSIILTIIIVASIIFVTDGFNIFILFTQNMIGFYELCGIIGFVLTILIYLTLVNKNIGFNILTILQIIFSIVIGVLYELIKLWIGLSVMGGYYVPLLLLPGIPIVVGVLSAMFIKPPQMMTKKL